MTTPTPTPTESSGYGLCRGLLSFVIATGIILLILRGTYSTYTPHYYLVSFSVTSPLGDGTAIASYQLEIKNMNRRVGVHYEDIALSLSPGDHTSVVPAFYQGILKTAEKSGIFTGRVTNGTRMFRLGLESSYWSRVWWQKKRHHGVSIGCDVEVDGEGENTVTHGIRLTSGSVTLSMTMTSLVVQFVLVIVFLLICQ